jgi:hypothetical protein
MAVHQYDIGYPSIEIAFSEDIPKFFFDTSDGNTISSISEDW